jgi:hypothetical protein
MRKNSNFWRNFKVICIFVFFLSLSFSLYPSQGLKQRLNGLEEIHYNISFNGIPSGYIVWKYQGQDSIENRKVDVLVVESDTNILKFLDLVSFEKIYLDGQTHLPVRVERKIKLFGSKETIEEEYNQDEGEVVLTRKKKGKVVKKEVYKQDTPIHNILDLLYFFPKRIKLEDKKGKWLTFNLPNQKVQIKFHSKRKISIDGKKREAYFLVGKGAKRFNLWLSLDEKIPLRLDFLSWLGKVIIRRENLEDK